MPKALEIKNKKKFVIFMLSKRITFTKLLLNESANYFARPKTQEDIIWVAATSRGWSKADSARDSSFRLETPKTSNLRRSNAENPEKEKSAESKADFNQKRFRWAIAENPEKEKSAESKADFNQEKRKRLKSTELHLEYRVDWLQGTFPKKHLGKVLKLTSLLLNGGEFKSLGHGIRYFETALKHPTGAIVACGHRKKGRLNENLAYLELRGSVLFPIKQRRLHKFMRVLRAKCGFKCSHTDLTIDDFSRDFSIATVKKAIYKHHYTGFGDTVKLDAEGRNGLKGEGIALGRRGSKGSGKRICFYDKGIESKGRIDAIRIELNCYQEYAQQSFEQLCDTPYLLWGKIIGGWIAGAVDFRRRQGENDKNPGRRRRLSWWAKLVGNFEGLKPARTYNISSIEGLLNWVRHQVAPSLAVFMHCFGKEDMDLFWKYFYECIFEGESRFKEKHWYLIQSYEQYLKQRDSG